MLIGAGTYDRPDQLHPIPAAANNLDDLHRLLSGPGGVLDPDNCRRVLNPASLAEIGNLIEHAAEQAADTLIVYYTGHGILDSRGRLHLALTNTDPERTRWTALSIATIREAIAESSASTRILLLDCCFSGRALDALTDGPDAVLGQADIAGTYTITSSSRTETSYAPPGHRNTAFTAALLAAATQHPGVALDDLYLHTQQHLRRHAHPEPRRRADNNAGRIVLFPRTTSIPGPSEPAAQVVSGIEGTENTADKAAATSSETLGPAEAQRSAGDAFSPAAETVPSLEDIRAGLLSRQEQEHKTKLGVYERILTDASRGALFAALRLAIEEEVISAHGVRSVVWDTDLYYRFLVDPDEDKLTVLLEKQDGALISTQVWEPDEAITSFYLELVEAVRAAGEDRGVLLNDPTESVIRLSKLLVEVANLRAQSPMGYRDTIRKVFQKAEFGGPEDAWFFTERALIPAHRPHYEVLYSRLDEMDWSDHLRGKGWYSADQALHLARLLAPKLAADQAESTGFGSAPSPSPQPSPPAPVLAVGPRSVAVGRDAVSISTGDNTAATLMPPFLAPVSQDPAPQDESAPQSVSAIGQRSVAVGRDAGTISTGDQPPRPAAP
ncbi:caspase family protein [Nocardia aurea]|uniref:caspase family protein n=1 Tax=Nocardia aurea TaxID=2144174 RepID=UPI00130057EE|nr:caspase family protein [Nocardia aurea]